MSHKKRESEFKFIGLPTDGVPRAPIKYTVIDEYDDGPGLLAEFHGVDPAAKRESVTIDLADIQDLIFGKLPIKPTLTRVFVMPESPKKLPAPALRINLLKRRASPRFVTVATIKEQIEDMRAFEESRRRSEFVRYCMAQVINSKPEEPNENSNS